MCHFRSFVFNNFLEMRIIGVAALRVPLEPPSFHTVLESEAVYTLSRINLDRFASILANVIVFRINSDPPGACAAAASTVSLLCLPTVLPLFSFPRQLRFGLWHLSRYPPDSYYCFLTSRLHRPRRRSIFHRFLLSRCLSLHFTFPFADQGIDTADLVCNEKPFFHPFPAFGVLVDVCITYGEIRFDGRVTDTRERNFGGFLSWLVWEVSFAQIIPWRIVPGGDRINRTTIALSPSVLIK